MKSELAAALEGLSHEQAVAVWKALGQFVENTREVADTETGEVWVDHADPHTLTDLRGAETVLEKMDAVFARLAA